MIKVLCSGATQSNHKHVLASSSVVDYQRKFLIFCTYIKVQTQYLNIRISRVLYFDLPNLHQKG